MRRKAKSQSYKERMKELEKLSSRIKAKMAKLEKAITNISESLN